MLRQDRDATVYAARSGWRSNQCSTTCRILGSTIVRTVDVGAILQQAIAELYPMLINGVPLTYTKEGNRMKVFLGTDLLLPLMKNIVAPLFEDEEFLNMVIEAMKSDPQFGGMAGMMVPTLKLLPEIIKNTTQLEIGLDLTQVK